MIYTTFKQWVKGRFLETGEPRKQAYSKDELLLIEMGWNYGYDAGASAECTACEALHDHEDVIAPIGNSSWGEAYQEGWAQGTAAYRDAIRARGDKND